MDGLDEGGDIFCFCVVFWDVVGEVDIDNVPDGVISSVDSGCMGVARGENFMFHDASYPVVVQDYDGSFSSVFCVVWWVLRGRRQFAGPVQELDLRNMMSQ